MKGSSGPQRVATHKLGTISVEGGTAVSYILCEKGAAGMSLSVSNTEMMFIDR